jgi:hypothetical protein
MADLQLARQAMFPTLHASMTRVSGCINSGASTRARNSISRAEVQRSKCIYRCISLLLFGIRQRTFPIQICVFILLPYSIQWPAATPSSDVFDFPIRKVSWDFCQTVFAIIWLRQWQSWPAHSSSCSLLSQLLKWPTHQHQKLALCRTLRIYSLSL